MFTLKWTVLILILIEFNFANTNHCGLRANFRGTIVGGKTSIRNEWPWLAGLVQITSGIFFCGGSLVSEYHVLTAAHCLQNKQEVVPLQADEVVVHLGRHNFSAENEPGSISMFPSTVIIHPDWDSKSVRFDADLAILLTEKPVKFSLIIQPICLWSSTDGGDALIGTIVGWGKSEDETVKHEEVPHQVDMKRLDDLKCVTRFPLIGYVFSQTERTFCTDGAIENTGPCSGDSGGGFFVEVNDRWYIQGIISASSVKKTGECNMKIPALFTKISSFSDWLNQILKPAIVHFECNTSRSSRRKCFVDNLNISDQFSSLEVDPKKSLKQIQVLIIYSEIMKFLPINIGELFSNLKELFVVSGIETVSRGRFLKMENLKKLRLSRDEQNKCDDTFCACSCKGLYRNSPLKSIPFDSFYDLHSLEFIDLSYNSLQDLNKDLFLLNPNLLKVELSYNLIEEIEGGTFINNGLLKTLYYDRNSIKLLDRKCFRGLKNLKTLSFIENRIEKVPFDTFYELPKLENLDLRCNRIKMLHPNLFVKNLNLVKLHGWHNDIEVVELGLFRNNQELEELHFDCNKIIEVKENFDSCSKLKYISFRNNICIDKRSVFYNNLLSIREMIEEIKMNC